MKIIRTFDQLATGAHDVHLAIGVFDGVHRGHQRVIGQALADARQAGGTAAVLTFDPHPARILRPDKAPLLLTSTDHKLRLIDQLGVDLCLLLNFDKPFSEIPAVAFLETLLANTNRLREICVGTRFRFGHDRLGDVRLIEQFAASHGFTAREIESVKLDNEIISSTAVRQHVVQGHLDQAAAMLGRPYSILGTVQKGDAVGHQLGFPTANLDPHNEAFPPDGVYAARAIIGTETFGSVLNLGRRPSFEGRSHQRILEVHILDFDRELYGQELEVVFLQKLRDEQKFATLDALKAQIAADLQAARALLRKP